MPGVRLFFMQSCGGLTEAHHFQGKDAILSGPAGGIVGMVRTALAAGHRKLIGFDMGGTSTDVSHYAGEFERAFETQVAGVRMRAPMMSIHTVAAGGGLDPRLRRRAAARRPEAPAPTPVRPATAAAGRWPPPTPTCCWASIQPASLSACLRPRRRRGAGPRRRARASSSPGRARCSAATGRSTTAESLAAGYLRIAVQTMANAIKRISVARGYDVTQLHAAVLRRRRRPACLRRGRCAGHDAHLRAPAGGRAVGLRHGPGRPDRDARGFDRAAARRRWPGRGARARWPSWAQAAADELVAQGVAAQAVERRGHCTCATRAPTRRWCVPFGRSGRARARPSRAATGSASPS